MIPVDFTINTDLALEKALTYANTQSASIHLLHVGGLVKGYNRIFSLSYFDKRPMSIETRRTKLAELAGRLNESNQFLPQVHTDVHNSGNVEKSIIHKAREIHADLVVIGKSSQHWIPLFNTVSSGRVAKTTGIPVLTVKPGASNQQIKTVVIPLEQQFSASRLAGLVALVKKTRIHVCLLAFAGKRDKPDQLPTPLLNSYRLFKKNEFNDVSFNIIREHNKGRAVLNFCKSVSADLLVINPELETGVGWFNGHISDALPAASKTQIFAV